MKNTLKLFISIIATVISAVGLVLMISVVTAFIPEGLGILFQFILGMLLFVVGMLVAGFFKKGGE